MKQKTVFSHVFLAVLLVVTITSGCSWVKSRFGVYKIDVQQGNVLTQKMINQLRPGMTKEQVRYVLGTPLIVDTFNANRWDYIYSIQPGGQEREQQRLAVFFENDRLTYFQGSFQPQSPEEAEAIAFQEQDSSVEAKAADVETDIEVVDSTGSSEAEDNAASISQTSSVKQDKQAQQDEKARQLDAELDAMVNGSKEQK